MIAFIKKNLHQKFIPGIFQRDFRKCWLREFLESVFIIDIDSNITASIAFDWSFDSLLTTVCLQNKHTPSGCLKKINQWRYMAVNDFIEFQNCTAFEKGAIAPKFLQKTCSEKKFTHDSAT